MLGAERESWYTGGESMRALSTILVALVSAAACAAVVSPTLPVAEWPDREATTNAALPVATWQRRGHFDVRMSVAAGTNLVQLAFGRDADGDGELSRADRFWTATSPSNTFLATWQGALLGRRADGTPTGLTATNEAGVAVFTEWRHAPPAWSFDPSWDTVRVVSSGADDADGRVRVEIGPDGTLFIMR